MSGGRFLECVLKPFGWLYGGVTRLRNLMYDHGLKKQKTFPIPVISVGNITVGGTGKTPHTEYLVSFLGQNHRVAVLSRGYGRRTKGYIFAGAGSNAALIGDEPNQIHEKFPTVPVAVCEDRCKGIERLMEDVAPEAVILDDAFQHRRVRPSLNILLVDYNRNIMDDSMLPCGRLRENPSGRSRADMIVVTKCPWDLQDSAMEKLERTLRVAERQQVFFTSLSYGQPVTFDGGAPVDIVEGTPILLVTGIANPQPLRIELERLKANVKMHAFPDHHVFSRKDIDMVVSILDRMGPNAVVVTTQKDQSRLKSMDLDRTLTDRIAVMPVKVSFLKNGEAFRNSVEEHVSGWKKN